METVSGTYISPNGVAANIECGFVPDRVKLIQDLGDAELYYDWFKVMGDTSALTGQFGIVDSGGAKTVISTAATGIIAYNTTANKQMLPAPNGEGLIGADLPEEWTQARASAASQRSTTALGTIIKPTSGNENGLIFECTNDATGGATEPTWPTKPGDSVTDGSVIWIARESIIRNLGVKGFTVGASINTNGDICVFVAEKHDKSQDMGDADVTNPVLF